jgi:PAS domain S-box-containing protein
MACDQQIGYVFSGQFFFEDEPLDYELFRSQARKYGFNEEEYITALEKVPRLSRKTVNTAMDFFMTFANMLSQLSYSNIKLSQSLAERDSLMDVINEGEKRYRMLFDNSLDAIILSDPRDGGKILSANTAACRMLGWEEEELIGRGRDLMFDPVDPAVSEVLDELISSVSAKAQLTYRRKDGTTFPVELSTALFMGSSGEPRIVIIIRDITERKKAEEAIRLSNLYNRSLIEASLDPLVTIGPNGKIMDANGATELVTGYSRNELIGTDFSDYFTEPEKARKGSRQAFVNGEVRDYPLEIQHRDGHITPVLYNASVYKDENGEIIGVFAAAHDIAEHQKAEKALKKAHENLEEKVKERTTQLEKAYTSLKESEERLAEAQKMAHIGNWDWNLVTNEVYWSEELYRIFGREPQESGASFDELLNFIHPDDRDYMENVIKKGIEGRTRPIDYRIILANGKERTVHTKAEVIFDEKNIAIQAKGIVQDITESKKAEEKIKTLANAVESSNDAIVTESLDGIITSWNKAAEQIYGYSAEEILGQNVSILEPDDIKGEIKRYTEKIKQGKKIQHYETSRLKKDGTLISVSVTLSPIFNASGELVAISAIVRDVTERKKAEEALRDSEARLRRFYESGMFGVFYFNLDGSITDANDKFLEIVGYTRDDLQAGRINWNTMTPPECRPLNEHCIAELKAKGVNAPYEQEYIRKDGSYVPVVLGASTFDRERREGIAFVVDITERKQREHRMHRYYNVLEGINRIFGSVVRAETEQELGNVCLSVALEVTGSQIGFVGEAGACKTLHCITVSNMEWAKNLIYDKAENPCPLDNLVLHGMYSRIIDSGKSFFTNDPPLHPEVIGLPYDHLPLTSFLGVPLILDGKTMGLITVANREGGYSCEQQEDLEVIAPAVIQALQRRKAEKALAEINRIRIKEIHHRIKNNLQVISSLLDLQAERFQNKDVLEAFKESQNRVISMSLIHEELYKGEGNNKLNFSAYLRKLAESLFQTYSLSSKNVKLCMDLEENAFFDMDIAVPLGIIVNELVSNSLKHAFTENKKGEIQIHLCRKERDYEAHESTFNLTISDNGKGIPENMELESFESLGLKLVNILVNQLDGEIELKKTHGTEFRITFNAMESQ